MKHRETLGFVLTAALAIGSCGSESQSGLPIKKTQVVKLATNSLAKTIRRCFIQRGGYLVVDPVSMGEKRVAGFYRPPRTKLSPLTPECPAEALIDMGSGIYMANGTLNVITGS